ncbi:hypothetical protein FA15DRAFT_757714 [Coprinopsis marcescibilis]|uniref:Uncharacterized protein n=1 Tax=Coprinopsis marcescibilis TaxID=230819 RepID=A0A5C3KQM7_COPMA|nr:hypothetical protein FA15DRAFT_757714 [Coprinopsis marcescibilis]
MKGEQVTGRIVSPTSQYNEDNARKRAREMAVTEPTLQVAAPGSKKSDRNSFETRTRSSAAANNPFERVIKSESQEHGPKLYPDIAPLKRTRRASPEEASIAEHCPNCHVNTVEPYEDIKMDDSTSSCSDIVPQSSDLVSLDVYSDAVDKVSEAYLKTKLESINQLVGEICTNLIADIRHEMPHKRSPQLVNSNQAPKFNLKTAPLHNLIDIVRKAGHKEDLTVCAEVLIRDVINLFLHDQIFAGDIVSRASIQTPLVGGSDMRTRLENAFTEISSAGETSFAGSEFTTTERVPSVPWRVSQRWRAIAASPFAPQGDALAQIVPELAKDLHGRVVLCLKFSFADHFFQDDVNLITDQDHITQSVATLVQDSFDLALSIRRDMVSRRASVSCVEATKLRIPSIYYDPLAMSRAWPSTHKAASKMEMVFGCYALGLMYLSEDKSVKRAIHPAVVTTAFQKDVLQSRGGRGAQLHQLAVGAPCKSRKG